MRHTTTLVEGCELRYVRGEWGAPALASGLPDERERRPDMVVLFNADAYTCPWRRTLLALMRPRRDLRHSQHHRLGGGDARTPAHADYLHMCAHSAFEFLAVSWDNRRRITRHAL